jgi:hypothetical protein
VHNNPQRSHLFLTTPGLLTPDRSTSKGAYLLKTLYRCLSALMLLMSLSAAQAAGVPISTMKDMSGTQCLTYDTTLTMQDCDGGLHQNFNFLSPYGWIYQNLASGGTYVKGSFPPATTVSMSLGSGGGLNGVWWRPAGSNKIHFAGGTRQCLTRSDTGVEMQDCIADADHNNQDWLLESAVAPDWPYTGLTYLQNSATNGCIQAPGAQARAFKNGTPLTLGNCEEQYPNEYFEFTNSGAIKMMDKCLTAGSEPGDSVTYENCDDSLSQRFVKGANYLRSQLENGLCLGVANDSMTLGAALQVQTCKDSLFQNWELSKVPGRWPPAGGSIPETAVEGATLTVKQLESVVDWIQAETSIDTTPFCYKAAGYDRGPGIAANCGDNEEKDGILCYPRCRSGYTGVGPVCWTTQSLTYTPSRHCISRAPKWLGGRCLIDAMNSCRDGYHGDKIATCYIDEASYGRGGGNKPTSCNSNRKFEDSMCYLKPRAGYTCVVTVCSPVCASGTFDCGPKACANSQSSCAANITDMVVSSVEVLASIASAGTMGVAKAAVETSLKAVAAAGTANELYQAQEVLRKGIGDFMNAAEKDLASISTPEVAAAVASGYVKGSANYRYIAREWASRMLAYSIVNLVQNLGDLMISAIDPSGAYAVYNAFAKPPCTNHTTMPQY